MKTTQQIAVNRIFFDHLFVSESIFPDTRVIFNIDLKRRSDKLPIPVEGPFRNLLAIIIERLPHKAFIQRF